MRCARHLKQFNPSTVDLTLAKGITMSIIERFYAPLSRPPRSEAAIDGSYNNDNSAALHRGVEDSAHFWALQLLSVERREAVSALYEFCSKLEAIVDDDVSRSLKQTLLSQC